MYEFEKIPGTGSWAFCPLDGSLGHTDHDTDNRHPAIMTVGPITSNTRRAELVCLREQPLNGGSRTSTVLYKHDDNTWHTEPQPVVECSDLQDFVAYLTEHRDTFSREDLAKINNCLFVAANADSGNTVVLRYSRARVLRTTTEHVQKILLPFTKVNARGVPSPVVVGDIALKPVQVENVSPRLNKDDNEWDCIFLNENDILTATFETAPAVPIQDDEVVENLHLLMESVIGPNSARRAFVMEFMAQCMQHLTRRPPFMLLIIGKQGTGKSLLMDAFQRALSNDTPSTVGRLRDLLTNENTFNAHHYQSRILYIEEADRVDSQSAKLFDTLKSVISQESRIMNQKHQPQYKKQVFTRFVCTSNHLDCVLAIEGMRRRLVVFNNEEPADQKKMASVFRFFFNPDNKPRIASAISHLLLNTSCRLDLTSDMAPEMPELEDLVRLAEEFDPEKRIENYIRDVLMYYRSPSRSAGSEHDRCLDNEKISIRRLNLWLESKRLRVTPEKTARIIRAMDSDLHVDGDLVYYRP